MHGKKKRKHGRIFAAAIGSGIALTATVLAVGLLTGLVLKARVGEETGAKIVYGLHVIAVFAGAELAKHIYGVNDIRIAGMAVGIYVSTITVAGMLMDGNFQNIGLHILAICIALVFSCALCIRRSGSKGKKKSGLW